MELKPCPFCGCEAKMLIYKQDGGYTANIYCTSDSSVGCFTRQFHWALKKEWAIESAKQAWNRRT